MDHHSDATYLSALVKLGHLARTLQSDQGSMGNMGQAGTHRLGNSKGVKTNDECRMLNAELKTNRRRRFLTFCILHSAFCILFAFCIFFVGCEKSALTPDPNAPK